MNGIVDFNLVGGSLARKQTQNKTHKHTTNKKRMNSNKLFSLRDSRRNDLGRSGVALGTVSSGPLKAQRLVDGGRSEREYS